MPETVDEEEDSDVNDNDNNDTPPIGDPPDCTPTEADIKMKAVCGDCIHQNDGKHLDGGIKMT